MLCIANCFTLPIALRAGDCLRDTIINKLSTLKYKGEKIMKNILQLTKAIILTLAAVIMLLNTNVLTAYAGTLMFPGMTKTEDGKIRVNVGATLATDSTGREWYITDNGYPYCVYKVEYEEEFRGMTFIQCDYYLDYYLTDYIESHNESEWTSFVIKGSDGIPFYYTECNVYTGPYYYGKFCYDKESGWWIQDKAYKGPNVSKTDINDLIEETKTAINNDEEINGAPVNPAPKLDIAVDSDDVPVGGEVQSGGTIKVPENPSEDPDNPPKEDEETKDPYADVNTLGATVTLKTDCIKVKKNNAPQKPLPKSVKVGKKALKRNKTFTVSYEKYTDDWHEVSAVTDEGIYRLVVTGRNGYEGVYKKRLYVTADKTIKAMSLVSVKVNKVAYTGNPITSGVIKTAKIGKRALTAEKDYTVTYTNNTDSGTAQVTLTAKEGSGLLGTKTVNFTITGNKMSKVKVAGISSITYNPNETLEQDMANVKLTYNGTLLNKDTDFTVSYVNNTKAGTAKIVFTGKGLYYGTLTKSFKIAKAPLIESMLDDASKKIEVTYTGKAIKPEVTLKNGDTTLKKGTDYTLTYKNNKKVSTAAAPAQITVKGKGSYTGSFKVNFAIIAKSNGVDEKSNAKNIKPDADEPTEEKTETDEPTGDELATDEPTEEEPEAGEATGDETVADEPTGDEPVTDAPTDDEPATDEPTGDEPVTDEPAADEPTGDDPVTDEPAADEPTGDEPATDEPVADEPTGDEPVTDEPVADEPTGDKPVADEPTGEESVTDEPVADEPTGYEPVTDDATKGELVKAVPTVNTSAKDAYIIVDIYAEISSTVKTTAQ